MYKLGAPDSLRDSIVEAHHLRAESMTSSCSENIFQHACTRPRNNVIASVGRVLIPVSTVHRSFAKKFTRTKHNKCLRCDRTRGHQNSCGIMVQCRRDVVDRTPLASASARSFIRSRNSCRAICHVQPTSALSQVPMTERSSNTECLISLPLYWANERI